MPFQPMKGIGLVPINLQGVFILVTSRNFKEVLKVMHHFIRF